MATTFTYTIANLDRETADGYVNIVIIRYQAE